MGSHPNSLQDRPGNKEKWLQQVEQAKLRMLKKKGGAGNNFLHPLVVYD
jgi:hypothetical protein